MNGQHVTSAATSRSRSEDQSIGTQSVANPKRTRL